MKINIFNIIKDKFKIYKRTSSNDCGDIRQEIIRYIYLYTMKRNNSKNQKESFKSLKYYLEYIDDKEGLEILDNSLTEEQFKINYLSKRGYFLLNELVKIYDEPILKENLPIIDKAYESLRKYNNLDALNNYYGRKKENCDISLSEKIKLIREILLYLDESTTLLNFFDKKFSEGKIIIYNDDDEDKVRKILKKKHKCSKRRINELIDDECCYDKTLDMIFILSDNSIYDICSVIHEFIHQYCFNINKNENELGITREIPSVYYEMKSAYYLLNNIKLNEQMRNEIYANINFRITNDSYLYASNLIVIINLLKIMYEKGEITKEDLNQDKMIIIIILRIHANLVNEDFLPIKLLKSEDLGTDDKIINFLREIYSMYIGTHSEFLNLKFYNKTNISYCLGGFLALDYIENEEISNRMLNFINSENCDELEQLRELFKDIDKLDKNKKLML